MAHTLHVACSETCDAFPADCDCSIYAAHLSMTCSAERDAGCASIPCGNLERCGCAIPPLVGPRTVAGYGPTLLLPNGALATESIEASDWVTFVPTCPVTGLAHDWFDGDLCVPGTECFAKLCADNNDVDQFSELGLDRPGDYELDYTVVDGTYPEWSMRAPQPADLLLRAL